LRESLYESRRRLTVCLASFNRDAHSFRPGVAKGYAEREDEQDGKDEDPEDYFWLAQKFAHTRRRQFEQRMKRL
jgi:hypothetical protein